MKHTYIYALFLALVFHASCGRSQNYQQGNQLMRTYGFFGTCRKPVMEASGGVQEELGLAGTLITERPTLIFEEKKAGDTSFSKVANQTNPDLGLFCTKLWFRSGNRVIFAHDETAP